MKTILSICVLLLGLTGLQANAYWTCTYSCGSKGQEPKLGHGQTQDQACQEAKGQQCTEYGNGYPQYYQGMNWVDDYPGNGYGNGGGYGNGQWECTYSCGSKGQEPKVGYGWSQQQASQQAQSQQCSRYGNGYPQYFQGCQLTGN